jgi:hypothetical protein
MTRVVNLRVEAYDAKICRGTIFGNPFQIVRDGTREQVIERYREWFNFLLRDEKFKEAVLELRGLTLGCFCAPFPCHGQVIADYLNNLPEDESESLFGNNIRKTIQAFKPLFKRDETIDTSTSNTCRECGGRYRFVARETYQCPDCGDIYVF